MNTARVRWRREDWRAIAGWAGRANLEIGEPGGYGQVLGWFGQEGICQELGEGVFRDSNQMHRILVMKVVVVLAMLLSVAWGPVFGAQGGCANGAKVCAKGCCQRGEAPCCAVKGKAQERPAPVQQRVGQDLTMAVGVMPSLVLFTLARPEVKQAPRELLGHEHSLAPLVASCIRLI